MKRLALTALGALAALLLAGGAAGCAARGTAGTAKNALNVSGAASAASQQASGVSSAGGGKTLVAYFSCTGNTKSAASYIAGAVGGDLYEITPQKPYSASDLDYSDKNSRSTSEQNDPSVRPAIAGKTVNMEGYSTVFVGYPIWWGQAPRIINTFLESYDFTGKKMIPFCTSGATDISGSIAGIKKSCSAKAVWLDGKRFSGGAAQSEIAGWAKSLGIK